MKIEATTCIFAKPPVAGKAKTRLAAGIGNQHAAQLAEAFLRDTIELMERAEWTQTIVAATEPFERDGLLGHAMWMQPEGTLDQRIESILRRALLETPAAFALGADSPGLPVRYLEEARSRLRDSDVVLGPSCDGGFYLIGLKNCPEGLLRGIEWSRPDTLRQTIAHLKKQNLTVDLLPEWFDVDTVEDLRLLEDLVERRTVACRHTATVLQEMRQPAAAGQKQNDLRISVVIPVLNERAGLPAVIESVRSAIAGAEIIAVDGGSTDGSLEWLQSQTDIRVIESARGKGIQQNTGGRTAGGDVVLFLHADCLLPKGAGLLIAEAMRDHRNAGGCFSARWSDGRLSLRIHAFGMNLRTRWFRRCYGDQAIFVRKSVFDNVGGFPDWPLFEDAELVKRMKSAGRLYVLQAAVTMSARRFQATGVLKGIFLVYFLQIGFLLGVSPVRLKTWFADIRPYLE